jgi:hypothetical protein
MRRLLLPLLLVTLASACGASSAPPRTTPAPSTSTPTPATPPSTARAPQSLDEALAAAALTRIEPALVARESGGLDPRGPRVEGRRVTLNISAGWNQESPVFARRANGEVVLVEPRPTTIVDRHIPGGCRGFVGGRAWFETVVYELPEGTRYAGTAPVSWEEHIEVVDWTDTEADGSPCPPPAID